MFIEWWQAIVFAIVTGLWAEWRFTRGVKSGVITTIIVLKDKNMVKINEDGELVQLNMVDNKFKR